VRQVSFTLLVASSGTVLSAGPSSLGAGGEKIKKNTRRQPIVPDSRRETP
jgi:hypothetical protein